MDNTQKPTGGGIARDVEDGVLEISFADYDMVWELLESTDGEFVADLKYHTVGGREYLRVVDGTLEKVGVAMVRGNDGEFEEQVTTKEPALDRFEQLFSEEWPILLRHKSDTPFEGRDSV